MRLRVDGLRHYVEPRLRNSHPEKIINDLTVYLEFRGMGHQALAKNRSILETALGDDPWNAERRIALYKAAVAAGAREQLRRLATGADENKPALRIRIRAWFRRRS